MPVSIGLGIADIIAAAAPEIGFGAELGLGAADVAAGVGAAEVGAGVAAGDIAAAAVPEAAAFGGDVFATGAAAVPFGAESAAGLGTGLGLGAGDVGAAAAGFGDVALTGGAASTAAVPFGAAGVGGLGGLATAGDVLAGGATGPLAALDTSPIAGDFAALGSAGFDTSVGAQPAILGGDIASPIAGDVTSIPETFSAFTDTTPTFGQTFGAEQDALAAVNQAAAGTGLTPANVSEAAYGFPAGETAGAPTASSFAPTEASAAATATPPPPAPTIEPTIGPGATPGAPTDLATAAPADIGSTIGPGAPSNVSPGLAGILSGSNLKTAATLAPLGMLGYTLARGPPALPPAEQQALANAGTISGFGSSQLKMAKNNQITPAQQAQIDIFVQNSTDQAYQLYANQGGDPTKNTGYLRAVQAIQQQAIAMKQQFVNAEITNGISAMGVADQTLQGAAQMQVANDNAFSASVGSLTTAFGFMALLNAKAA